MNVEEATVAFNQRNNAHLCQQNQLTPILLARAPYSQNVLRRVRIKCSLSGTLIHWTQAAWAVILKSHTNLAALWFQVHWGKRGYGTNVRWSLVRVGVLWGVKLSIFLLLLDHAEGAPPPSNTRTHHYLSRIQPNSARTFLRVLLMLTAPWHLMTIQKNVSDKLKQLKGNDFKVQCVKTISKQTSNVWCQLNVLGEASLAQLLRSYSNFQ